MGNRDLSGAERGSAGMQVGDPHGREIMPVTKPNRVKISVHFASLTDHRQRKIKQPLITFIVVGICKVICGADDFVTTADFGR